MMYYIAQILHVVTSTKIAHIYNLVLVKNITAMGNSDLRKYKGVLHIKIDTCSLLFKFYLHFVFIKGVKTFFFLKKNTRNETIVLNFF